MELVYIKAYQKFKESNYLDLSNMKYTMAQDTYQKWLEGKNKCRKIFNEELESVLQKDVV